MATWQQSSPTLGGTDHSNIMEIMLMLVPLGEIKTEESNIKQLFTLMTDPDSVIMREYITILQYYMLYNVTMLHHD